MALPGPLSCLRAGQYLLLASGCMRDMYELVSQGYLWKLVPQ